MMMNPCILSKLTESTTPRINPNVNYRLWPLMMCQRKFIDCNKRTTLVQVIDSSGGCVQVRARDIWEILVHGVRFCCEPHTALKNKVCL